MGSYPRYCLFDSPYNKFDICVAEVSNHMPCLYGTSLASATQKKEVKLCSDYLGVNSPRQWLLQGLSVMAIPLALLCLLNLGMASKALEI